MDFFQFSGYFYENPYFEKYFRQTLAKTDVIVYNVIDKISAA